jgi:superfamily II DNA or RNA helicase
VKKYIAYLYEFDKEKEEGNIGVLKVPRGLGIDVVRRCLDEDNIQYSIIDDTMVYATPKKIQFQMRKNPRNDEQIRSINFLNTTKERQKMLCLDVGRGKTYCATHYIKDEGVSALIISYNLSEQWVNKILEYTDCINGKDVILIIGSSFLEECLHSPRRHHHKIYVCSMGTLISFASQKGNMALQKVVEALGIGIKIFDEAHMRYLQFNTLDLNMQVANTLYLTATPGRSKIAEKRMFSKIYYNVKTYGNTIEGYNNHYIIKYITYNSKPNHYDNQSFMSIRGLKSTSYSRYLFDKYPSFAYKLVLSFMKPIFTNDKNAKILIILDWLKDMELVKNQFRNDEYVKDMNLKIGTYCQLVKNPKEKEEQLKSNIIIGSIGSMQNGRDIDNLQAIFTFTQFSSEIVTQQLLGRLRQIKGKEVIYYDIADSGVFSIMKQRQVRRKIFEQRSTTAITEYKIPDMDNIEEPKERGEEGNYFKSVYFR